MLTIRLLAALPLTCLFAGAAFGQACTKPLTLTNEVQMESVNGGPSLVPVKLNGTDQKMTLSTVGATTQLTPDGVKTLKLETHRGDTTLTDDFGNTSRDEVTIADFSMGRLHGTNVKWPVSPAGGFGGGNFGGGNVGIFSLNYMRLYDVDADFGTDKLRFFSQDHCPGGVLYWKAPAGAVGVLPITIDNGRVTVPVTLEGKAVTAVINTAAPSSSVRRAVAERVLGVELGGPKAPAGKPDFSGNPTYTSNTALVAGALKLDGVALNVLPDFNAGQGVDPANTIRARASAIKAELEHPEVVLGMNVLRKLHIYLAFGENKLYVTGTTSAPQTAAKSP